MGKLSRILAVMMLALALVATSVAAQGTGKPRFEVDSSILDLGEVDHGAKVDGVFVIRNTGDATLEILDVRPG